jgi:hypothetical protein
MSEGCVRQRSGWRLGEPELTKADAIAIMHITESNLRSNCLLGGMAVKSQGTQGARDALSASWLAFAADAAPRIMLSKVEESAADA